MRRVSLPDESLYPLQVLFAAVSIYGVATLARGSGFLAAFLAGIVVGDARAPFKREIQRFHGALASLGEIPACSGLIGLIVSLRSMVTERAWLTGLALAVLLTFVNRPIVVGGLLTAVRLRWGERIFVVWSGLKGAVPILLGTFILTADLEQDLRLFDIVLAVVAFSIVVQGGLVPLVPGADADHAAATVGRGHPGAGRAGRAAALHGRVRRPGRRPAAVRAEPGRGRVGEPGQPRRRAGPARARDGAAGRRRGAGGRR